MKTRPIRRFLPALASGLFLAGCVGGDGGGGSTVVYGDFGYVGPVGYDEPDYGEGGVYVHPPFGRDDHHDDRDHAPAGHPPAGGGRSAPSIPQATRPSGGGRSSGGGERSSGGGQRR
jgi:hypothetical protein